jgi:hypothetical protein
MTAPRRVLDESLRCNPALVKLARTEISELDGVGGGGILPYRVAKLAALLGGHSPKHQEVHGTPQYVCLHLYGTFRQKKRKQIQCLSKTADTKRIVLISLRTKEGISQK